MRKIIIALGLFFILSSAYSQVEGISASKLGTYCAETISATSIEFEPAFNLALSTQRFDDHGTKQNLFLSSDSIQQFSSFGFRFTYGLFKDFEIGVSLPIDISTLSVGAKYKLPFKSTPQFGIFAGYNAILGNEVYVRKNAVHESTSSVGLGFIISHDFSDKFGLDINAQYHKHFHTTVGGHSQGFTISTDIGYYLFEDISFIVGFVYSYDNNHNFIKQSNLFTFNPGIAIEKAKNFILVLNAPIDIIGKNEYQTVGFGLALTILLN